MKKKYLYAKDRHNRITEIYEENDETIKNYGHYIHGEFEDSLVLQLKIPFDSIVNDKIVYVGFTKEEQKFRDMSLRVAQIETYKQLLQQSDWKVVVNGEYIQAGLEPKYPNLHKERQIWRDEINKLENE